MIPTIVLRHCNSLQSRRLRRCGWLLVAGVLSAGAAMGQAPATNTSPAAPHAPAVPPAGALATELAAALAPATLPAGCLPSGDGYLRAHVAGAVDSEVDWPNSGTRCEGEPRDKPPGVRMSFHRLTGGAPDLLFVFGLSGVREGQPARAAGANLTIIVQSTGRIYSTLGDHRCTIDSLAQRPLAAKHLFRVEAHGFCTQPARAVRGPGDILVSTFDFAGLVSYDDTDAHDDKDSANAGAEH
jgi:hypothetical protein